MTVYILSRNSTLYSTKRLLETGQARGWDIHVIDYMMCNIEIMKGELAVIYNGELLPVPDAVIPCIGENNTFYGTEMVRHFEIMGAFSVAGNLAIERSRNRLRSLQVLSKNNIDMPKTVFASNKANVKDVINLGGGTPLVIKILEESQGVGAVLVETQKAAQSVLDAFYGMDVHLLVQEFIKEAEGVDIRSLVVNGEVVCAMKYQGADGDFRSKLHKGGSATSYILNKKEISTALAAAKAMELGVCEVEMIPSDRGPLVMEVNYSPRLEEIDKATDIDIADKIMDYIEESISTSHDSKRHHQTKDNIEI